MRYGFFLFLLYCLSACQTTDAPTTHGRTNHLANESSPYLLQHAHNPVDWYPWKASALEKAQTEDKLLVISIGYAACHWCHVMEAESFSDSLIAEKMNAQYVSIKVDREERPDVDQVYMSACQLASQKGCGWPLNVIALPTGEPVWVGTYLTKPDWERTLDYFAEAYQEDSDKMKVFAQELTQGIQQMEQLDGESEGIAYDQTVFSGWVEQALTEVDYVLGGQNKAPKFPMPVLWDFLLRYQHYSGDHKALDAVTTTLDAMANGGIYDHLGGGFARYSVDKSWHVPHFEKMLYDNGQLVSLYAAAYQATGKDLYRARIVETLDFIARELTNEEGAFFASLNADSEGEEGKFYVWSQTEIDDLCTPEEALLISRYYQTTKRGNWEHGKNILHIGRPFEQLATDMDLPLAEAKTLLQSAQQKLYDARAQRIRPSLDDKVLTAWNAIMLKGYADAYAALGEEAYRTKAIRNGQFILSKMRQKDGRLLRNYKDGKASINAFADDYALTIQAFLSLYRITFDQQWLREAEQLADYTIQHFYDKKSGLLYYTSDLDDNLIVRQIEQVDNVIPSSNSVFASSLYQLGTLLYKDTYIEQAKSMLATMEPTIKQPGRLPYYANWGNVYLDQLRIPYEVAIVGPAYAGQRDSLLRHYLPHAYLLGGATETGLELLTNKLQADATTTYVCQQKVCKLPVYQVEDALGLMRKE